ncbi:PleD family two-component system response regulator [uncultured Nitratireductor sp.]|uniref:PleD family two-component system response regulator n=1 Tax=uncultured Nitratireductor sp. TaxID=520953 RepID=UPI002637B2E8|nr:PleD family two-component system response regulator [uncultured Nitratireductor sp.]
MTARILVVDDVPSNVKLLESRLLAEYFEVVCAHSGAEALKICADGKVDVVLLDVMMPELDGFEVCRRLKADPATQHIPVIMVTSLEETADRIRGLEAGADDFLSKPVNDLQLVTRVKSLVRLKMLTDELRLRTVTARNAGFDDGIEEERRAAPSILLIDEDAQSSATIANMLRDGYRVDVEDDPQAGLFRAADGSYECILVTSAYTTYDPLRLCAQLRALDRTRLLPVMLVADKGDDAMIARALELGVNDYIVRPVDQQELMARLRTQLRRKRYNDRLRSSVSESFQMAVTDPLTGLHNRRYLDTHLPRLLARAAARGRPLSVMMADIDCFKAINDSWGHQGGDDVLREFADRLRQNIRGIDLICRFGGEEFVVVIPDTPLDVAETVAERLRVAIASDPFTVDGGKNAIAVTTSVGVVATAGAHDDPATLLKRVDLALYDAKNAGRNCVVAPAA